MAEPVKPEDAPDTPTPEEFAHFDQTFADVCENLDALIATHRHVLAQGAAPRQVDITGLCAWIDENLDSASMAEILTAAVDRLTTQAAERAEIEQTVRVAIGQELYGMAEDWSTQGPSGEQLRPGLLYAASELDPPVSPAARQDLPTYRERIEQEVRAKVAEELLEQAARHPVGSGFRRHLRAAAQFANPPSPQDAARALNELYEQEVRGGA